MCTFCFTSQTRAVIDRSVPCFWFKCFRPVRFLNRNKYGTKRWVCTWVRSIASSAQFFFCSSEGEDCQYRTKVVFRDNPIENLPSNTMFDVCGTLTHRCREHEGRNTIAPRYQVSVRDATKQVFYGVQVCRVAHSPVSQGKGLGRDTNLT